MEIGYGELGKRLTKLNNNICKDLSVVCTAVTVSLRIANDFLFFPTHCYNSFPGTFSLPVF